MPGAYRCGQARDGWRGRRAGRAGERLVIRLWPRGGRPAGTGPEAPP